MTGLRGMRILGGPYLFSIFFIALSSCPVALSSWHCLIARALIHFDRFADQVFMLGQLLLRSITGVINHWSGQSRSGQLLVRSIIAQADYWSSRLFI